MFWKVSDPPIEQVPYSKFLQALHSKSFTWSSLPIGKNSNYTLVKDKV